MWLDKLSRGFLQVLTETGLHYVKPSFAERLRLIWIFRNFSIVTQQVLNARQQHMLYTLCSEQRMFQYWVFEERERGGLIGTLLISVFPSSRRADERRGSPRSPVQFEVRYGVGKELTVGEGCDFGGRGLAFVGPKPYPPGTELELRYRLDPQAEWSKVRALVRDQQGHRMGVEFLMFPARRHSEDRMTSSRNEARTTT